MLDSDVITLLLFRLVVSWLPLVGGCLVKLFRLVRPGVGVFLVLAARTKSKESMSGCDSQAGQLIGCIFHRPSYKGGQ